MPKLKFLALFVLQLLFPRDSKIFTILGARLVHFFVDDFRASPGKYSN